MAKNGHNPGVKPDPKTTREYHIRSVSQDPDFRKSALLLKAADKDPTYTSEQRRAAHQNLSSYYALSEAELNLLLLPIHVDVLAKKAQLDFEVDLRRFTILFGPDASKTQVMEAWGEFEEMRSELFPAVTDKSKRKLPAQPELIYAVFKALKTHSSVEIFKLYESGELPGYNRPAGQFDTDDELMHYYNRYKPTPTPDT